MTIRTISQLPLATGIQDNDLLEISQAASNKYVSKKCEFATMKQNIGNEISNVIGSTFGLYHDRLAKQPLNVKELSAQFVSLSCENVELSGVKTFTSIPKIQVPATAYLGDIDDTNIPNITKTKDLIDNRACFISEEYVIDGDPGNDAVPSFSKDSELFMHWHIDDNGTDSTKWIDPQTKTYGAEYGVKCTHSGFLTIYGWLADKGGVLPQNAWVGLYGNVQMYTGTDGEIQHNKWVLLQLQPWIRGTNATQLQYVGFNLPVKEGLRLKIKTGFNVNGQVGGFQHDRSATYALNQPNSFVGYITRAED